ncbi:hypothetical protein AHAS_Ahas20G0200900 [Arachis hypogaea]
MFSGWSCKSRLIKVDTSRTRCKGRTSEYLVGYKRRVWYCIENLDCLPPGWDNGDPLQDGCRNKIWDPGIQDDQFWELKTCEELHQSLGNSLGIDRAYWKSKHWWQFQDEFKHKPP